MGGRPRRRSTAGKRAGYCESDAGRGCSSTLTAVTQAASSVWPFLPLIVLGLVLVFIFRRPKGLSEVWFTTGGAGLLLALGYLHAADVSAVLGQTAPTLAFLAGMLVVAFVADRAGVFQLLADRMARRSGGSPVKLYVLLFLLGSATTIFFSLDTTAVTLTPIVLAIAARLGLPLLPFVWLAVYTSNAASLLLPVSNLTNLIAVGHYGIPFWEYARAMFWPAVFVLAFNLLFFVFLFRDQLKSGDRPSAPPEKPPDDHSAGARLPDETLTRWVGVGLLALLSGLGLSPYLNWPLWQVSTVTALLLTPLALGRRVITPLELVRSVSWNVIPFVFGLFLLIRAVEPGFYRLLEAAHLLTLLGEPQQAATAAQAAAAGRAATGAAAGVAAAAGAIGPGTAATGAGPVTAPAHTAAGGHAMIVSGPAGVFDLVGAAARFAVLGAVSANLVNNLPAELLFLDLTRPGPSLCGLLLGVNLGPNLTIIGSLATILVLSLARQAGAAVSFRDYLRLGVLMTPALLLAALAGVLVAAGLGWLPPAG